MSHERLAPGQGTPETGTLAFPAHSLGVWLGARPGIAAFWEPPFEAVPSHRFGRRRRILRLLTLALILAFLALVGDAGGIEAMTSNWREATVDYYVDVNIQSSPDRPVSPEHLLILVPVPQLDGRPIPAFLDIIERGKRRPRRLRHDALLRSG